MEPYRALISDRLRKIQIPRGFLTQSLFTGAGAVLANMSLFVMQKFITGATASNVPYWVFVCFWLGAVCCLVTISIAMTADQRDPADGRGTRARSGRSPRACPPRSRRSPSREGDADRHAQDRLAFLFQWYAMFIYWQFVSVSVGESVFNAAPETPGYEEAAAWTGLMNGTYNFVTMISALFLLPLCLRFGGKRVHAGTLLLAGVSLAVLSTINTQILTLVPMIGLGICWASMVGVPYLMVASMVPRERTGVYMGILNMMIVVPMLIQTLTFGWIFENFLDSKGTSAILLAGVLLGCAGARHAVGQPAEVRGRGIPVMPLGGPRKISGVRPASWSAPTARRPRCTPSRRARRSRRPPGPARRRLRLRDDGADETAGRRDGVGVRQDSCTASRRPGRHARVGGQADRGPHARPSIRWWSPGNRPGTAAGGRQQSGEPHRRGQPGGRGAARARCWARCRREIVRNADCNVTDHPDERRPPAAETVRPCAPRARRSRRTELKGFARWPRSSASSWASTDRTAAERHWSGRTRRRRTTVPRSSSSTVWHPPTLPMSPPYGHLPPEDYESQPRNEALALLEQFTSALVPRTPAVEVQTSVVEGRNPAEVLIERSEEADLVVVGSRGHGGFARHAAGLGQPAPRRPRQLPGRHRPLSRRLTGATAGPSRSGAAPRG